MLRAETLYRPAFGGDGISCGAIRMVEQAERKPLTIAAIAADRSLDETQKRHARRLLEFFDDNGLPTNGRSLIHIDDLCAAWREPLSRIAWSLYHIKDGFLLDWDWADSGPPYVEYRIYSVNRSDGRRRTHD